MGAKDVQRQQPNVFRMKHMGAKVTPVDTGSGTLKDAVNEALRDWTATLHESHYLLGTAAGPHPFPTIVREFHRVISTEAKAQLKERIGALPDPVVACVGGGFNTIGIFADFVDEDSVELVGAEPGGERAWIPGNTAPPSITAPSVSCTARAVTSCAPRKARSRKATQFPPGWTTQAWAHNTPTCPR